MNQVDERLTLFQELLSCVNNLYIWKYDDDFHLLSSNAPEKDLLHAMFTLEHLTDPILNYAKDCYLPFVFSNSIDMTWIAFFEAKDGVLLHIYLLGPVFTDANTIFKKDSVLNKYNLSPLIKRNFMRVIHNLPLIGITQLMQYAIMMHYCITREKICTSDFHYMESSAVNFDDNKFSSLLEAEVTDRRNSYLYEQRYLKMVEDGNIQYLAERSGSTFSGTIGKLSIQDSLRQTKNMILASIVLCTRAAIRGGLAPEIAYTLSDKYIQDIESCSNSTETIQVYQTMLSDFVHRVHIHKTGSNISPFVKMCCDYINLHLEDDLSIKKLAAYTGYAEHYLGKKFKKEMNISLKQYINQSRIGYAKLLLETTTLSIAEICDRLHFCSCSYFTKLFRELTGTTPVLCREQVK